MDATPHLDRHSSEDFMRHRRFRPGTSVISRGFGLVFLVAFGCSEQEELQPDPGVSPMFPGPTASTKAPEDIGATGSTAAERGPAIPTDRDGPLRPEDVERQLRTAMRAAERGDSARATALLDRILALEPVNREALLGRAALALDQAKRAATPEERAAAIDKAGNTARALRRAYEKPNSRELDLFARVLHEELRINVAQDRLDRAIAVLKEAYAAGFDPFSRIENDTEFAKLRSWPGYQALLKEIAVTDLAKARAKVKNQLDRPLDLALDFKVQDLDGKTFSLDEYKGKVVLVDLWGTWCKPCREAIPALIQFRQRFGRRGFEVIGLDYEQNAPDPETARQYVKRFVQESGIPYRIAMGDPALIERWHVPGYPTTILVDRSGKARMLVTGGGPEALDTFAAAIQVLLAESPAKGSDVKEPAKPPVATKGTDKAPSPPPAATKGAARRQ
jgi:thiol-disulfide isomerase/thioredoxin